MLVYSAGAYTRYEDEEETMATPRRMMELEDGTLDPERVTRAIEMREQEIANRAALNSLAKQRIRRNLAEHEEGYLRELRARARRRTR